MTVQVHDTTVLVANAQNHSQHLRQRVDVEVLSVQLDTVRGTREGTLGTRLPIRSGCGFRVPVSGNRSHLVEPVGRSSNGRTTHVVVGLVTLVIIETSLQNHLRLRFRNHIVEVDVRTRSPVTGRGIQSHIETLLIRTHVVFSVLVSRVTVTVVHLIDDSIVRGVANTEGLVLRTTLIGAGNLVQRGSTVDHRKTNCTRSRILTSSRDRVGGLRRSHSRGTCDGASRSIQIYTRRKRRIGSARSESINSRSNTHALETAVESIRSFRITEDGRHRTIAHQELNLIQVNGSALSSTERYSVHRETIGGNRTIELRPRASRMASSRSRVKLQEGSSSRVRSLNRKGSRMTAGITVRPNADRRDSGNEGTHARVGERSGNGGRGRIRVTSPRDRIAVVVDASARHSEIHRSNVAVVLVGNTSAISEVSVELNSRRDARLREMELHSEHTRRVGSSISRTVDSAVVIDTIASSSHRSSGHITFRHVVTIYLHTVDVGDDTSTGTTSPVQHRFCPLHSSYYYTNSTPILPRPPLLPETRYSYSLAQIPVYTTLWYEPVHTIPRFSAYLFVPSSGTN